MEQKNGLLVGSLDRHEAHGRPLHRFADSLGIGRVVLLALNVRLDELWWHEPDRVPQRSDLARPMMCRVTRLDADQRGLELREQRQHFGSAQLTSKCRLTRRVDAVDLEHVVSAAVILTRVADWNLTHRFRFGLLTGEGAGWWDRRRHWRSGYCIGT